MADTLVYASQDTTIQSVAVILQALFLLIGALFNLCKKR